MSQCRCGPPDRGNSVDDRLLDPATVFEKILGGLKLPADQQAALAAVDVPVAIVFMRQGGFLAKYPRAARVHRRSQTRMFKADMDSLTLRWLSPRRSRARTHIPFTTVERIIPGCRSNFFRDDEKELGIELISSRRKLRVVCPNAHEWKLWMRGMCYMMERAETKRQRGIESQKADFIRTLWDYADSDKSGSLLLREVVSLTRKLGVQLDVRYIELVFTTLDQDKTNVLDYVQFRELIKLLIYSPEGNRMFAVYGNTSSDQIRLDGIKSFLLDVQKEKEPSAVSNLNLLSTLDMFGVSKDSGMLNEFHWCRLLLSEWNTVIDEVRLAHCHDMAQPLCQFFIYACDDPFDLPRGWWANSSPVGASMSSGQRKHTKLDPLRCLAAVLSRGVRFLRVRLVPAKSPTLDEHEVCVLRTVNDRAVDADEPLNQVDFRSFMATVKSAGFLTSVFPVILHLEFIGCASAQRLWAIEAATQVCGDCLYAESESPRAPTVEALAKKIVLAAPIHADVSTGMEAALLTHGAYLSDPVAALSQPPLHPLGQVPPGLAKQLQPPRALAEGLKVGISARALTDQPGKLRGAMELYSLTGDQLVEAAMAAKEDGGFSMCRVNTHTLAHCFASGPAGLRAGRGLGVALASGVQCVSVPLAADGMAPLMQQALFWQNGLCGYVAKPKILGHPQFDLFDADKVSALPQVDNVDSPHEVRVTVLEGRQMPRGPLPLLGGPERLCPFVIVSVRGLPEDCVSRQTRPAVNSGFAPRWDGPEFAFRVTVPTVSFLCFEVRHFDSARGSVPLAGAAFVVTTLRQGLRWVPLRDQWARRIPWCGLLVRLSVRPLKHEQQARPHSALMPSKLDVSKLKNEKRHNPVPRQDYNPEKSLSGTPSGTR